MTESIDHTVFNDTGTLLR